MESWSFPPAYDDGYLPPPGQEHWFPERETMDPEERDAAILERIKEVCAYAYERAPFYRRRWGAAGVEPGDIKTFEDFERLPVITKNELRADQAEHPPFGSYSCIEPAEVVRVHGTSGTTGRPTAFGIGGDDWRSIANAHARIMWGMGIRPSDTVFIGSVFSLYMGSWATLSGTERLGAAAFPFGAGVAGQSQRAVNWMAQMKPEAFYGTPSYALRLAEIAAEEGIDPRDFGIRILFFSGEPGASIPSIRERIESLYGGKVFDCGSMARDDAVDEPRRVLRAGRPAVLAGHRLHRGLRPRDAPPAAVRQRGDAGLHAPRAHQPADDPPAVGRPHALGGRPEPVRAHLSVSCRAASTAGSTTCSRSAARTSTRRRSTRC